MENHTSIYTIPAGYSSLTIKFCSEFRLESVLITANRDTVIVEGSGMPSKLTCHQEDTGIYIHKVTDLKLRDIQLISCGNQYRVHMDNLTSSVYIINCTDVTIERFSVTNSHGNGVTMLNNRGEIMIEDSTFESSSMTKSGMTSGGNGLHIELSYCGSRNSLSDHCMNINHSQYRIRRCYFKGNNASDIYTNENLFLDKDGSLDRNLGKGGGVCIVIDGYSTGNSIQVEDCNFTANSAKWGGGLYLVVQEASQDNSISFTSCSFINNTCDSYAGGGATVGYQSFNSNQPKDNSITFRSCIFEGNHAQHGGGMSFYSTPSHISSNKLEFYGCNWSSNTAIFGAAVKVSPDALQLQIYDLKVKISFTNCNFTSNHIIESHSVGSDKSYETGKYAFLSVGCNILFKGDIIFNDNNGTALCMKSAKVEFSSPSNAQFSNNRGFQGGAMSLLGISTCIFNHDSKFTFKNNFAERAGGAIFQKSYDNDLNIISRSCFLEYSGNFITDNKNVTFLFQNNTASEGGRNATRLGLYGHSIYATTIRHCFILPGYTLEENFRCIGNFTFIDKNEYDVSTAGNEINGSDSTMRVIPGKIMKLPVMTLNELSKEVSAIYLVSVNSFQNSNVSVDSAFTYASNKLVKFYGNPGDKANIVLETVSTRRIVYNLNIKIEHCPPGYANNKSLRKCECSKKIMGIHSCNNFEVKLYKSYWIGYSNNCYDNLTENEFGEEDDILFSFCPSGYCGNSLNNKIVLPQTSSMSALNKAICGKNRTGVLCSKCREGYVLHYHGYDRYKPCRSKDNCKIGWLLYIISEIIPTTILFAVVMVFNISFTDGVISGCVFFFQVSTTMSINQSVWFPRYAFNGLQGYRFFSRIFHLDYFAIDSFSFCLWETATALDLIAFKYITILYASTLVVAIITAFKYCHSKRLNEILIKMKGESATSTKATIIHGVSGFLVICYSECIRISLLLLTPVKLHAVKDNMSHHLVSFYDGEAKFFQDKHLLYAILALLIILIVGVLPPLILISYPLCYKVLALLKISETKFTKLLCKCIPLEKLKPFFDSFQSSYKDEYRFFSGLHFFYRLIALIAYANANLNVYYCILQVEFAIILTAHCICQPYKKRWHNILDALLFMILSTVNAISLFNYHLIHRSNQQCIINKTTTILVILLYVPIIYVAVITAVNIFKLVKKLYANRKSNAHKNETNNYLEFFNLAEDL